MVADHFTTHRDQGTSSNDINLVVPGHAGFSARNVKRRLHIHIHGVLLDIRHNICTLCKWQLSIHHNVDDSDNSDMSPDLLTQIPCRLPAYCQQGVMCSSQKCNEYNNIPSCSKRKTPLIVDIFTIEGLIHKRPWSSNMKCDRIYFILKLGLWAYYGMNTRKDQQLQQKALHTDSAVLLISIYDLHYLECHLSYN